MDKSEGKEWFAKTLNSVTEETTKVYTISRMKLELGTITKTKHEKMHIMARKLLEYINDGKIDAKMFESEYSTILKLDEKKTDIENKITDFNSRNPSAIKNMVDVGVGKVRKILKIDNNLSNRQK